MAAARRPPSSEPAKVHLCNPGRGARVALGAVDRLTHGRRRKRRCGAAEGTSEKQPTSSASVPPQPNARSVFRLILGELRCIEHWGLQPYSLLPLLHPCRMRRHKDPVGGAILGGATGGIIGGALGGGRGAAIGAIIGGSSGAIIAAQGQPRGRAATVTYRMDAISSVVTELGS